jgi:hypothetical protein
VQGKAPKDEEGRQALNAFLESLKGLAEPVPPRKRTIKRVTN